MMSPKNTLVIKSFKNTPDINVIAEKQLAVLEENLNCILNSLKPKSSLQELFRINENLYNTHGQVLYDKLHDIMEAALLKQLETLSQNVEQFTVTLDGIWKEFCTQIRLLKNIYLPCDRSVKNPKFNTVHHIGYKLFKSVIITDPFIKGCLIFELMYIIHIRRKGEKTDNNLLKSLLVMLSDLQLYEEIFYTDFLRMSHVFYLDEGKILIDSIDVRQYLKHVKARLIEEEELSIIFPKKCAVIMEIVRKNLINDHLNLILDKVFELVFKNQLEEELGLVYELLSKVALGLKTMSRYFSDFVINKGKEIMSKPDNEKNMIQSLLEFKDWLDYIVINFFDKNETYNDIIRNSFSKFVNVNQNVPAQLLAKYIDSKLRAKELSERELEIYLDKAMVLFRYIQGKDIFEAFYKKDLAKRLLLGKSTSQDAEDNMIGKLKAECGAGYTSKIEGMFKDINISQGLNNAFKQHLNCGNTTTSSDLCINVLTSSFWPSYPVCEINLPSELVYYQITFQNFYANNHSGRKLMWQPNMGHCIVKAAFDSGNKELQVSLFQTIVLLLFNDTHKLTFSEIQDLTNIEKGELRRTLMSLACKRSRVLLKNSKSKDIQDDDTFTYNSNFNDKLFRVKINQIQLKESFEERQATEKSVLADRQFQIDAAIVRILKNKKRISHNELMSELFNTFEVPVKPYDLKKRIELLIEREYLDRDKDDPAFYTYIA